MNPTAPCRTLIKANPHIAFRVASLDEHLKQPGVEIIIPPFVVGDFLRWSSCGNTTPSSNTCTTLRMAGSGARRDSYRAIYTYAWDLAEAGCRTLPYFSSGNLDSTRSRWQAAITRGNS